MKITVVFVLEILKMGISEGHENVLVLPGAERIKYEHGFL